MLRAVSQHSLIQDVKVLQVSIRWMCSTCWLLCKLSLRCTAAAATVHRPHHRRSFLPRPRLRRSPTRHPRAPQHGFRRKACTRPSADVSKRRCFSTRRSEPHPLPVHGVEQLFTFLLLRGQTTVSQTAYDTLRRSYNATISVRTRNASRAARLP